MKKVKNYTTIPPAKEIREKVLIKETEIYNPEEIKKFKQYIINSINEWNGNHCILIHHLNYPNVLNHQNILKEMLEPLGYKIEYGVGAYLVYCN